MLLPGDFNRACSEIFGGMYQGLYMGNQAWAAGMDSDIALSPETSRKTFHIAFAALASQEMFEKYRVQATNHSIEVTSVFDASLEVTALIPATKETRSMYKRPQCAGLKPVGRMKAKTWHNPIGDDFDLTVEEEQEQEREQAKHPQQPTGSNEEEYEFWIEDDLLRCCFVGMKFETRVHRTSFGVDYFDAMVGVWCDFYTVLPNELVIGWRDPGPRLPMRETHVEGGGDEDGEGEG